MPSAAIQALWDLPAPAKINRFLHVVGRRPDGYHLLQSVFQMIDWCDRLHIECRSDGQLRRHDLGPSLPPDDLTLRAARALQAASGCTQGADIHVDKQVPWGAGLGGGSSDAATTLLALNHLWGLHWPRERLMALALPLGADIPFFLCGRHALVQGIGEQLTPLALPLEWVAVIKPPQSIATAAIFGSPLLRRDAPPHIMDDFLVNTSPGGIVDGFGRNDLQPAAEDHCPAVAQAARWLEARFGNSRMSGSGSAVFARAGTGSQPTATWAADELPLHWVGRLCRSLDSHPLGAWAG